ncbi:unnamed protein product, partial [Brassica oleracea]
WSSSLLLRLHREHRQRKLGVRHLPQIRPCQTSMDVLEGTSSQIFIINFCVVHSSRRGGSSLIKRGDCTFMKITLPAIGVLPLWWCDFSFWEARNVKGGVELMGLDMLILDSKGGPISKLIIILEIQTLKFRNHSEVLRLANKNTHLICELTAVKSIVSDPTQGKHRVMTGGLQLLPVMMMLQEA